MMLSGWIAVLIARDTHRLAMLATRKSILPQPTPCSPVQVPSRDNARWTSRSLSCSASAISFDTFGLSNEADVEIAVSSLD